MWQYGVLAALFIGGGVFIGMYLPDSFVLGGWISAAILLVFAAVIAVTHWTTDNQRLTTSQHNHPVIE
jgi:hypothetical protein